MPWKRPESVPLGQVWLRFRGRERDGKPATMYQIRDMEEKDRKRCLDMMQEHFLRDEPLCKVLGIPSDPESVTTIRSYWEELVSQHVSLACYVDEDGNPGELVGFNNLIVYSRDDPDEEIDFDKVPGVQWRKLLRVLVMAERLVDIFQHYSVDRYLGDSGMIVTPAHRGHNICARFLEAREPICKAFSLEATTAVFTATPSQHLAAKYGMELLATLPYEAMKHYGIDLSQCESSCAQLRGKKFCFDNNNVTHL